MERLMKVPVSAFNFLLYKGKMTLKDKIKCFFGLHKWEKYMGPENYGNGKFMQRYICKKCRKIKKVIR